MITMAAPSTSPTKSGTRTGCSLSLRGITRVSVPVSLRVLKGHRYRGHLLPVRSATLPFPLCGCPASQASRNPRSPFPSRCQTGWVAQRKLGAFCAFFPQVIRGYELINQILKNKIPNSILVCLQRLQRSKIGAAHWPGNNRWNFRVWQPKPDHLSEHSRLPNWDGVRPGPGVDDCQI